MRLPLKSRAVRLGETPMVVSQDYANAASVFNGSGFAGMSRTGLKLLAVPKCLWLQLAERLGKPH